MRARAGRARRPWRSARRPSAACFRRENKNQFESKATPKKLHRKGREGREGRKGRKGKTKASIWSKATVSNYRELQQIELVIDLHLGLPWHPSRPLRFKIWSPCQSDTACAAAPG